MQYIDIHENQIYIRLAVTDSQDLKLLHFLYNRDVRLHH